jgi:hypothetical protein
VGARVKGEAPGWALVLQDSSPDSADESAHPEVIAISPDGRTLGAIAHTFHGEFSDQFPVGMSPVERVVAHAYNGAGYAHHTRKEWAQSARFFAQAAAVDPTWDLPPYNLACAYARLGDPRAEPALRAALERTRPRDSGEGGTKTKNKARADPDFALVADAGWFKALTAP